MDNGRAERIADMVMVESGDKEVSEGKFVQAGYAAALEDVKKLAKDVNFPPESGHWRLAVLLMDIKRLESPREDTGLFGTTGKCERADACHPNVPGGSCIHKVDHVMEGGCFIECAASDLPGRISVRCIPSPNKASNPVQQEEIRKDKVAEEFVNRLVSEGKAFKTEWIKNSEFTGELRRAVFEENAMQMWEKAKAINALNNIVLGKVVTETTGPNTTRGGHPVFIPQEPIKGSSIPVVWMEII